MDEPLIFTDADLKSLVKCSDSEAKRVMAVELLDLRAKVAAARELCRAEATGGIAYGNGPLCRLPGADLASKVLTTIGGGE